MTCVNKSGEIWRILKTTFKNGPEPPWRMDHLGEWMESPWVTLGNGQGTRNTSENEQE